jgi:hypothetical protein
LKYGGSKSPATRAEQDRKDKEKAADEPVKCEGSARPAAARKLGCRNTADKELAGAAAKFRTRMG